MKNGKFASMFSFKFSTQLHCFKSSESVLSVNNHTQLEDIVLMYSNVFFNSKFKFSRKCQKISVCVRRCMSFQWTCFRYSDVREI